MATVRDTLRSSGSPAVQAAIESRILGIVGVKKSCNLDELVAGCAPYGWDQVFLEVERLSRIGHLRLKYKKDGDYAVTIRQWD